jgi:hypothetical protein
LRRLVCFTPEDLQSGEKRTKGCDCRPTVNRGILVQGCHPLNVVLGSYDTAEEVLPDSEETAVIRLGIGDGA